MSVADLEQTLRDLPRIGTLVKDRPYRQVWRFMHDGRAYYLKFYPRTGFRDRFRRWFRGSPALAEFTRLQMLQKASIPAPLPVAVMMGFRLQDRRGDAVILQAIESAVTLDHYLMDFELKGLPVPDRRQLAQQIRSLVQQLARAKLGHKDLHLGNFLRQDNRLYLMDGYAVRPGGLVLSDLLMLGHSVRRFATLTDLARGWDQLGSGDLPARNPLSKLLWKRFMQGVTSDNRYFGRLSDGPWSGVYYKRNKYGYRWSLASRLEISDADWKREWPRLIQLIESDQLTVLKRSKSGDVLAGEIVLNGRPLEIIVKRPRRRRWYRYFNEVGRGSRPRRAWIKAWHLLVRGISTAWPLAMMERRQFGYVTDAVLICERVPGPVLTNIHLDDLSADDRASLLHRTGRTLRQIEQFGFSHFDAKASNWVVYHDEQTGPRPVLVDVDGIRSRRWIALGIQRLLRSMQDNPQYTPDDSLALCKGYAPNAECKMQIDE